MLTMMTYIQGLMMAVAIMYVFVIYVFVIVSEYFEGESNDTSNKSNSRVVCDVPVSGEHLTRFCMDCGLVKEVNQYGVELWPEPWSPVKKYLRPGSKEWNEGTSSLCPAHYEYRMKGESHVG